LFKIALFYILNRNSKHSLTSGPTLPLGDLGGHLRPPVEEGPISQVSKIWKKSPKKKKIKNKAQIYSTIIRKKKCIISPVGKL
jgi:hypothetical protein